MRRVVFILAVFAAAGILGGCTSPHGQPTSAPEKIDVATSVYPIYYFTSRIAADCAEVTIIAPPTSEPHHWEPSPKQIAELQSSDAFIYNGAGLEVWAERVADSIGETGVQVLETASLVPEVLLLEAGSHSHGAQANGNNKTSLAAETADRNHHAGIDPHFWLDPILAENIARGIKELLVTLDPGNAGVYNQNFSLLKGELADLHREFEQAFKECSGRKFVVTHEGFGYMARRYGLEQIPIMGPSADSEPSPARLAELSTLMRRHHIRYVFTEPLVSPKAAEVLASEVGAGLLVLHTAGYLTENDVKEGLDYLSIMRNNMKQLKVALAQ